MLFSQKWLKNHPQFLLNFLIHIDVLMLCRKFELIPTKTYIHVKFRLNLHVHVHVRIFITLSLLPETSTDPHNELHLLPEPLFCLPSDNISMTAVLGTCTGRIFLAGKDGCLYEIVYQVSTHMYF